MALDAVAKPHQLIASDRVEGTAVRRPNGDMIGHIERLMIDKVSGQVSYAVMSSGGFLGMGAKLLPLPWGRLRYSPRFEAYELDLDEDELRHATSFRADAEFDWGDRSQEIVLRIAHFLELTRLGTGPKNAFVNRRAQVIASE